MKSVYYLADPLSPSTLFEVPDVQTFLMQQYQNGLPEFVRIYHKSVDVSSDVTPSGSRQQIARSIRKLRTLPGPFYVVNHPGGPAALPYIAVAIAVAAVAAAILLRPKLPNTMANTQSLESANNKLGDRTNEARINGRVADIVGTVRSVPDMLGPEYTVYVDNVKRKVSYMCIGRGQYQIHDLKDDTTPISEISGASAEVYGPYSSPNTHNPQLRVGDAITLPLVTTKQIDSVNGQTLIPNDAGSVVRKPMRFQYPNQVLAQGDVDFTETFVPGDNVVITEAAQSDGSFSYTIPSDPQPAGLFESEPGNNPTWGEITFPGDHSADWSPGQLMTVTNGTVTWQYYDGGDSPILTGNVNLNGMYPVQTSSYNSVEDTTTIRLDVTTNSNAWATFNRNVRTSDVTGAPTLSRPSTTVLFDLAGTYSIVTVTATTLTLNNPEAVNGDWLVMQNDYGGLSNVLYPVLATSGDRWVGWFTVNNPRPINRFIINIVAQGGLYALDEDGEQRKRNVAFRIEAQRVDNSGNPFGAVHAFERVIQGSAVTRAERALTVYEPLVNTPNNNWRFRVRRITPTDHDFGGEIVDEIIWSELYVATDVPNAHFGNVTTVYTITSATQGATSIKSRRFNSLVTRMIPLRISGDQFTEDLHPTNNAAEILCFMALDPDNGRRTKDQLDFDSIYGAYNDVVTYFGTPLAGEFCYTFTNDTLSFEEIAQQIAQWGLFSEAYRRGSKLKLLFEKKTEVRSMLFNHRNTVPNSEEYSGSFGPYNAKGCDSVEFEWTDPTTDAVAKIRLPEGGPWLKPLKIQSAGIRNHIQAHFAAHREYMKILYQRKSKTFDALHMSNLLIPKNVVLCADGCRPETISGEVESVDGLVLHLDREIDWSLGSDPYIYLQCTDVSTDAIPISPGPDSFSVQLSRIPATPVVTAQDAAMPTIYTITFSTNEGTLAPYLVAEKSDKRNMTIGLQVTQYSDHLYDHDKDYINGIIQ